MVVMVVLLLLRRLGLGLSMGMGMGSRWLLRCASSLVYALLRRSRGESWSGVGKISQHKM